MLVLMYEGGEEKLPTNINFLLEQWGIFAKPDAIVRCSYDRYLHPKEALVNDGIVNKSIARALMQDAAYRPKDTPILLGGASASQSKGAGIEIVYPNCCSLHVQEPAHPILSSGTFCYPINVAIGAAYRHPRSHSSAREGRVVVLGSSRAFSDDYIGKESNLPLANTIVDWLCGSCFELDMHDCKHPDVSDGTSTAVPDIATLSQRLKSCLQEGDAIPTDFSKLFDCSLFAFDTSLVPEAVDLYERMRVKHEPLRLIAPQFEAPLPPLQAAVFPPILREPPPPALDLFDLDEHFASERVRLAHLANKCNDDDIEYMCREAGVILGVAKELAEDSRSGKHVLEYVLCWGHVCRAGVNASWCSPNCCLGICSRKSSIGSGLTPRWGFSSQNSWIYYQNKSLPKVLPE